MLPNVNMDSRIRSGIRMEAERPYTLQVARGLLPSDWGQEIIRRRRYLFSVLSMVMKAVIDVATEGD